MAALDRRQALKTCAACALAASAPRLAQAGLPNLFGRPYLPALRRWAQPYPSFGCGAWKKPEPSTAWWGQQPSSAQGDPDVATAFLDRLGSANELPFVQITAGYAPLFEHHLVPPDRQSEFTPGLRYFALHLRKGIKNLAWVDAMTKQKPPRYSIDVAHGLIDQPRQAGSQDRLVYDHRPAQLIIGTDRYRPVERLWNGLDAPEQFANLHRLGEWGADRPPVPLNMATDNVDVLMAFDAPIDTAKAFTLQLGSIHYRGHDIPIPEMIFGFYDAARRAWAS